LESDIVGKKDHNLSMMPRPPREVRKKSFYSGVASSLASPLTASVLSRFGL